jgi:hypothetical protein
MNDLGEKTAPHILWTPSTSLFVSKFPCSESQKTVVNPRRKKSNDWPDILQIKMVG